MDHRAADRRLHPRLAAHALAGPRRLAPVQRGAPGRPRAGARGRRRRADHLRRRAAAHAGLPLRHRGPALPAPADARADPARVPAPGDPPDDGLDARRRRSRPAVRARSAARATSTTRAPRSTSSARGSAGERRRGRPPGRGDRQRHLRVRRRRRAAATASRGSAAPPTGRAARSACSSPAASRSPRSPAAASRSAGDGSWRDAQVAGLRATVDAPHARWTRDLRRRGRPGLRARVRRARRARGERARPRRDGGLRAAVPGHGHRARRRARADDRRARPARPRVGRPGLGADRARRARVGAWTDAACAALTAVRPAGASNHAEESVWAAYWEPEGAAGDRGRPALHDLRRRGADAPGRARALARRRGGLGPPRGRRGALRLLARPRGPAARLRVLPLAPRGPDGRRPLRHPAPRRAAA